MNIAIIPAKSNSRRVPNKNILKFFGKEMIYYSISQALKSKLFDKIIVSTDSKKISKISKKYGAKIYFKRPKNLSDQNTGIVQVLKHSIKWLLRNNIRPNVICCIFPTAPLIQSKDLIKAFKIFKKKKPDFLISSVNNQINFHRSFTGSNKKKGIKKFYPSKFDKPFFSKKIYYDAGQFYFASTNTWLSANSTFTKNSMPFEIDEIRVRDLNTKMDLKFLKILFNNKN